MAKILSQSGISLADMYDVQGSIAGIEELNTRELPLVHEMGGTLFSERFSSFIRRLSSGALGQNLNWSSVIEDTPTTPYRILGASMLSDVQARVSLASLAIGNRGNTRELPILAFDSGLDSEVSIRFNREGSVVTAFLLRPIIQNLPHLTTGRDQIQSVPHLAFRGQTSAFGAGTVNVDAYIHLGFAALRGVSSHGLPIPSW